MAVKAKRTDGTLIFLVMGGGLERFRTVNEVHPFITMYYVLKPRLLAV